MLDLASVKSELAKIRSLIPASANLDVFGMPMLTDRTTLEMIVASRLDPERDVRSWKAFLSGVSNDGGNSVSDFDQLNDVLAAFYDPSIDARSLVLEIHAERKFDRDGNRLEMREREFYAIKTDVEQLLHKHPKLTVVVKHVSDERTLARIRSWRRVGYSVFAEICPHYLFRCHEDLYEGPGGGTAFNLHDLCWPLYKNEESMQDLRAEVLYGEEWVIYGSDWACHPHDPTQPTGVKVNYEGVVVGGVTILPAVAKSLVIDLFLEKSVSVGRLNDYLGGNARKLHGLPASTRKARYVRKPWMVPMIIESEGPDDTVIKALPFMRGQEMNWQLETT